MAFWAAAWLQENPPLFTNWLLTTIWSTSLADLAPKETRHRESLAIEEWNGGAETGAQDADADTIDVLGEQHRLETGTDLSKNDQPTGPTSEMLLGTDTINALKYPGISELVEDTCAAKSRVDVADVVEAVREAMDTLATSSQGTGIAAEGGIPLIPEDVASTLLDKWVKEFSASCEAWKTSHAQGSLAVPPPSANMSLLAFQHPKTSAMVVSFVHWIGVQAKPSYPSTKPKSRVSPMRAREVEIERGKVKFSTPLMHAEMNFGDVPYWVLFADVGQRMHKVKQGMREVVAQSPWRVKLSLETYFSLRSLRSEEETEDFGATRVNTCEVCSREGHGLQTCAFCLCTFHPVCCKRLLEYAAGVDFESPVKEIQHSVCLPSCFFTEAMLCSMCASTHVVDTMDV